MDAPNQPVPVSFLSQWGFFPCPRQDSRKDTGTWYQLSPHMGEGFCLYYEKPGLFSVSVLDLRLHDDIVMEYRKPPMMTLSYYDVVSGEELSPYRRLSASCIHGDLDGSRLYRVRFHREIPVRGIEVTLRPDFYESFLAEHFPHEFSEPKMAFISAQGVSDFPELTALLSRMRMAPEPDGTFYQEQIQQALTLMAEKSRDCKGFIPAGSLTPQDLINIEAVKDYMEDHFAFDVKADDLARIARMGQTKLRYCFKNRYGYTLTEFIQNKRISHAEYLLLKTDFTVSLVAQAVGYRHPGRFASLFKKNTGLLPDEYRQLMKNSGADGPL